MATTDEQPQDWRDGLVEGLSELATASQTQPAPDGSPAPTPGSASAAAPEAPAPAADPAPASAEAPQAATDQPTPAPETPASPPPEVPASAIPLQFRVDGREFQPSGATVAPDGTVAFTPDGWKAFHSVNVADRGRWREVEGTYRTQIGRLEQQVKAQDAAPAALTKALLDLARLPDDQAWDQFFALKAQIPVIVEKARADALQAMLTDQDRVAAPQMAEAEFKAAESHLMDSLDHHIAAQVAEKYPALKGQEAALRASLLELGADSLFGKENGQWVINGPLFLRELAREAKLAERLVAERTKLTKTTELQARNAATLAPTKVPVTAPSGAPTPVPAQPAKPLGKQQWRDAMMSDEAWQS